MTHIRKTGLRALSLNEGDRLIDVRLTDDTQDMLLITAKGRGIRFHESEVRAMGACTSGGRSAHDYRKRFRQAHTG